MTRDTEEALRRMSAASGTSPDLRTDPRAVKCCCGALLYPEQICECRLADYDDDDAVLHVIGTPAGWVPTDD